MDEKQIDGYLFDEMSETERENFEDRFFGSDELFFDVAERENSLVDAYTRGELNGRDLERFERSLAANPARREKVANARMLKDLIAEERSNRTITIAERTGFFAGLAKIFSFGSPAFQFASIGLIAILAVAAAFLLFENRRLGSLERELAASRQRESDLAARIENEHEVAGELTAELDVERERIQKLESEVSRLRTTETNRPSVNNVTPTIATLVFSGATYRGAQPPAKRLELPAGVTRVSVLIGLSSDVAAGDNVTVRLNGEPVAEDLRVRTRGGEPSVALTLPATRFKPGRNELTVIDSRDTTIATHFVVIPDGPGPEQR